jgi:hypothetical protein
MEPATAPSAVLPPVLPHDALAPLRELITIFGIEQSRDTWAWMIVFFAFFLGVVIGIILRVSPGRWYEALAAAIPVSLFALPVSAHTLFGDRGEGVPNRLDQIADILGARQMTQTESVFLWLGVVMLCGMLAPRILGFLLKAGGGVLSAISRGLAPGSR